VRVFQSSYRDRTGKKRTTRTWYAELRDHRGRLRRLSAFVDKRASEEVGRKLERLVSLRSANERPDATLTRFLENLPAKLRRQLARIDLLDGSSVAATKPLREHVENYERALTDGGATPQYVQKTVNRVKAILDGTGAVFLSELTGGAVSRFLAERRANGLAVKTSNHYLAAVKSFGNWLVRDRRVSEHPLIHLSAMNSRADRRHVRRPLEIDELRRLLTAARSGPELHGMTGDERYWLYRLAVETGLRSNELRNLTRSSFALAGSDPTVTIEAGAAKNRKAATLPLRPDTASELRALLANKLPSAGVFRMPRPETIVSLIRRDLANARAAWIAEAATDAERERRIGSTILSYRDDDGRVADFHALRVTFASQLLGSGVDVRTAKELMRHATINMTADVYACTLRGSLSEAVKRLPDLSTPQTEQLRATGTENADSVLALCLALRGAIHNIVVQQPAIRTADDSDSQPLAMTGTYGDCGRMKMNGDALRTTCEKAPPRGFEPLLPA